MNQLIKVDINEKQQQVVSGRELHEFLEVGTEYAKWFHRMAEYGFVENFDYAVIVKKDENPLGGRPSMDHAIKVDMAKELCMIQRTDKGKQARQYFIKVEKAWNSPESLMARALKMADMKIIEYQNTVMQLEERIEKDKSKVIFADAVSVSKTSILVEDERGVSKVYTLGGEQTVSVITLSSPIYFSCSVLGRSHPLAYRLSSVSLPILQFCFFLCIAITYLYKVYRIQSVCTVNCTLHCMP
ncbi:hypothetical protein F8154_10305 [Alkaliphilus pronyensis]|uniref:AntA/AntB antirepressor domain-containing protein n=1 Tax=Alkaliphilus pronyensis TaxID=1482732 RepID=A0A6I0FEE6_9FIRM|nr:antA/AntB antirepressor family protein [Alkaliphilus pronyensis]KAB3533851.1 hypothetical protein F8154_10305 [Alkaliphilus pronyensis]